jgi:hypothetical protein
VDELYEKTIMMHLRITHPLLREIRKKLMINFEELEEKIKSGKWSGDYLNASWMAKVLVQSDRNIALRLAKMFNPLLVKYLSSKSLELGKVKVSELEALFNSVTLLLNSDSFNNNKIKEELRNLLTILQTRNWLESVSLASYALFGLKGIVETSLLKDAQLFITKYTGKEIQDILLDYPITSLGMNAICESLSGKEEILGKRLNSGHPRDSIFLLLALSYRIKEPDCSVLREYIFSYLDKLTRKQFSHLTEKDSIIASCIGLIIINTGYEKAFLLTSRDYAFVRDFFESDTIAVPKKVEYFHEISLLIITSIIVFFVSLLLASFLNPHLSEIFGSLYVPYSPDLMSWLVIAVMEIVVLRICVPILFPQVSYHFTEALNRLGVSTDEKS